MWQVGDGTTTVVILAGELLKECKAFFEEGVHPQVHTGRLSPGCSGEPVLYNRVIGGMALSKEEGEGRLGLHILL